MELINNGGEVCTDSIRPQAGEESAGEIELYGELIAFAELSPESQLRLESSPEPSPEPLEGTADSPQECPSSEPVQTDATAELGQSSSYDQPVESVTVAPAAETDRDSEVLEEFFDTATLGSTPGGPLPKSNLPQETVYTGALSRGVCLACGAESGADDLFCLTCGDFVDDVASTLP